MKFTVDGSEVDFDPYDRAQVERVKSASEDWIPKRQKKGYASSGGGESVLCPIILRGGWL